MVQGASNAQPPTCSCFTQVQLLHPRLAALLPCSNIFVSLQVGLPTAHNKTLQQDKEKHKATLAKAVTTCICRWPLLRVLGC